MCKRACVRVCACVYVPAPLTCAACTPRDSHVTHTCLTPSMISRDPYCQPRMAHSRSKPLRFHVTHHRPHVTFHDLSRDLLRCFLVLSVTCRVPRVTYHDPTWPFVIRMTRFPTFSLTGSSRQIRKLIKTQHRMNTRCQYSSAGLIFAISLTEPSGLASQNLTESDRKTARPKKDLKKNQFAYWSNKVKILFERKIKTFPIDY